MSQPPTQTIGPNERYYWFLNPQYVQISGQFRVLPLEELAKNAEGKKIIFDGKSLEKTASEEDYQTLEGRLVDYLRNFKSGQSYGSVALNEVGDRFLSILEYLTSLEQRFKTDPERLKKLKTAVIKTFIEKVGDGAFRYIPKSVIDLYKEIKALYDNKRAELKTTVTPV